VVGIVFVDHDSISLQTDCEQTNYEKTQCMDGRNWERGNDNKCRVILTTHSHPMPAVPKFSAITLLAFVDTRLSTIGSYSEANALTMGGFYTRASMMASTY
jgi:hypothetical protein